MMGLLDWLDDRTGYRELLRHALDERIPGGARWRFVWGSTLVVAFATQVVTGLVLWTAYSPSAQTAWESVYFIQHRMWGGWLLRGVHHFMAQAMVVLLALHLMQVIVDGAYRAPREVNFWTGLILLHLVLGLALTGYLLPWDQKGYWATQVATKIMGIVPLIGPSLQQLVVGGSEYGHHTLTRFFALHAGVLPATLVMVLSVHLALFRRHGITSHPRPNDRDANFWPDQVLRDAVACLAVLLAVFGLARYVGAELGAPADPAESYAAARPEWYFLFLFQFLKFFHGATQEVIGAIVVPAGVMAMFFAMPLIGRTQWGHRLNIAFVACLLAATAALTGMAIYEDRNSADFRAAVADAHERAERAMELAGRGIPPEGHLSQLRHDPKLEGPRLFAKHCASCHDHADDAGQGIRMDRPLELTDSGEGEPQPVPNGAPNLYRVGREQWLSRIFDPEAIAHVEIDRDAMLVRRAPMFGKTAHRDGDMVDFVQNTMDEEWSSEETTAVAAALIAEAQLDDPGSLSDSQKQRIEAGRKLLADPERCAQCHRFHEENDDAYAPDLTGYMSRQWLIDFIRNPADPRFYGEDNDRMPAFAPDPHNAESQLLDPHSIELLVDWLRQQWWRPSESP